MRHGSECQCATGVGRMTLATWRPSTSCGKLAGPGFDGVCCADPGRSPFQRHRPVAVLSDAYYLIEDYPSTSVFFIVFPGRNLPRNSNTSSFFVFITDVQVHPDIENGHTLTMTPYARP
jgi:hypothetical protein